jgi:hypothetical protein
VTWVFKHCGLEAPRVLRASIKPNTSNFNVRTVPFFGAFDRHERAARLEPHSVSKPKHVTFPFLLYGVRH